MRIDGCTILDQQLNDAGIPIDGVSGGPPWRIDYKAEATPEQRTQGDAIAAAFVPDPVTWERQERRKRAAELLYSDEPIAIMIRGLMRLLYASVAETRRANGLPVRGWNQAGDDVRGDILGGNCDA